MREKNYDVVMIGSGIGGLVCGCFLAKRNKKVLIIEKNNYVGGYCTSFERRGFKFNSFVRGFVGLGKGGILQKIFSELNVLDSISILRPPIYDLIQLPGVKLGLHNNPQDTLNELINQFPAEENSIRNFFSFLLSEDMPFKAYKYRKSSFKEVIDEFFKDPKLKFLFNVLRIDSGHDASLTLALDDLMLIKGNLVDGGYFPAGGMQSLPNALLDCFMKNGGTVLLNTEVKKIIIKGRIAKGVVDSNENFISANTIVSNADATLTYEKLIGLPYLKKSIIKKIKAMKPSTALFVMYVALNIDLKEMLKQRCAAIWDFNKSIGDGIVCTLSSVVDSSMAPKNSESLTLYFGAPFNNVSYWEKNKTRIEKIFLERLFRIFPDAKDKVLFYESLSPIDLEKQTFNRRGSSRGWDPLINSSPESFPDYFLSIKNIFLVGHWVKLSTGNGGVAYAAFTGKKVAKMIC
jgi:all-trans-retinol 13,14-reductase